MCCDLERDGAVVSKPGPPYDLLGYVGGFDSRGRLTSVTRNLILDQTQQGDAYPFAQALHAALAQLTGLQNGFMGPTCKSCVIDIEDIRPSPDGVTHQQSLHFINGDRSVSVTLVRKGSPNPSLPQFSVVISQGAGRRTND